MENSKPLKVALYARVSTGVNEKKHLADGDRSKQDPETQLLRLRAYANAMGWTVYDEYVDRASGADTRRPQLLRMMEDARTRKIDIIVTTRLDRIMRSLSNLLNIMEDLDRWKVGFVCTEQSIETQTATGRLLIQLLGAVAEFERELIADRVSEGVARAKAQGKHLGRPRVEDGKASKRTLQRRAAAKRGVPSNININSPKTAMTNGDDIVAEGERE